MQERVKILVVDDLKENHLVMESVLSDPELEIIKALSGEEALLLCSEHDFAVVFMDVQMPNLDGFEVAEILRGIEKTKNIPIIFVTAISKELKSIFKGYEVGAVDYLSKPIDPIILRSKARIFKELYLQKKMIERQVVELQNQLNELIRIQLEKDEFENMSIEDELTKIYNRRGLDRFLNMQWSGCLRSDLPYSVLILDIDEFKNYNDNYGHLKGDVIIEAIAKSIEKSVFRPEDIVGRYGGDEFLVLMPNSNLDGAETIAKRILENVRALRIPHEFSRVSDQITVSIGIGTIKPSKELTIKHLIDLADRNLYNAKKNGRNQYYL